MKKLISIFLLLSSCVNRPLGYVEERKCFKNACAYRYGGAPDKALIYFPGMLDTKKAIEKSIFDTTEIQEIIESMKPVRVIVYSEAKIPDNVAWFAKSPQNIDAVLKDVKEPMFAIGHSMGGYNLAVYAAMRPSRFKKIALTNPMLLPEGNTPFNTISGPALILKSHYSKSEWEKLNPITLAVATEIYPKTLISSCKQDIWGLFSAAVSFNGILHVKGFDVEMYVDKPNCQHQNIPSKRIIDWFNND